MKEKDDNANMAGRQAHNEEKNNLQGYPTYPAGDDIYSKNHEEKDINPEDISKKKVSNEIDRTNNEKGSDDYESGDDLDIPGSELDDEQEDIGSEDEENNYYSLGGDDHSNLDENQGD